MSTYTTTAFYSKALAGSTPAISLSLGTQTTLESAVPCWRFFVRDLAGGNTFAAFRLRESPWPMFDADGVLRQAVTYGYPAEACEEYGTPQTIVVSTLTSIAPSVGDYVLLGVEPTVTGGDKWFVAQITAIS